MAVWRVSVAETSAACAEEVLPVLAVGQVLELDADVRERATPGGRRTRSAARGRQWLRPITSAASSAAVPADRHGEQVTVPMHGRVLKPHPRRLLARLTCRAPGPESRWARTRRRAGSSGARRLAARIAGRRTAPVAPGADDVV